jgi:tight adherence protein C
MATAKIIGLLIMGLFVLICVFIMTLSQKKEIELLKRLPNTESENLRMELENHSSDTKYGKIHEKYFANTMRNGGLEKYAKLVGIDIAKTEQDIYAARLEKKITVEEVVSMKLVGMGGAIVFFLASAATGFNFFLLFIALICYYLGSFYPSKMITTAMNARKEEIIMTLPNFIELVYSTLEAGATIQDALTMIATRTKGALSEEFLTVTARTQVSGKWRQEMELMAERCGVEQLNDLVSDILISYEKGTSVVEVLKEDSEQLRAIKNAKLTEKAKKLSVSLMIPMAIFLFLPMFALMLMPMLVQFLENF